MTAGLYQWSPRKPGKGWRLVAVKENVTWKNKLWMKKDG